jgi:hypothetical protein
VPCLSDLFFERVDHSPFPDAKVADLSQQTRIDLGGQLTMTRILSQQVFACVPVDRDDLPLPGLP